MTHRQDVAQVALKAAQEEVGTYIDKANLHAALAIEMEGGIKRRDGKIEHLEAIATFGA